MSEQGGGLDIFFQQVGRMWGAFGKPLHLILLALPARDRGMAFIVAAFVFLDIVLAKLGINVVLLGLFLTGTLVCGFAAINGMANNAAQEIETKTARVKAQPAATAQVEVELAAEDDTETA